MQLSQFIRDKYHGKFAKVGASWPPEEEEPPKEEEPPETSTQQMVDYQLLYLFFYHAIFRF